MCREREKETGIIEFFCGLYLHFQDELANHFRGDFAAAVYKSLPKHRSGKKGLFPEIMPNTTTKPERIPARLNTTWKKVNVVMPKIMVVSVESVNITIPMRELLQLGGMRSKAWASSAAPDAFVPFSFFSLGHYNRRSP